MRPLAAGVLALEPLLVAHADGMFEVLSDPSAYRHLDYGPPPSREHVAGVYAQLETRRSPDGAQRWLNWIVRSPADGPIGYVQATLMPDGTAWVAWFLASAHWGRGHAGAAASAMLDHLSTVYATGRYLATVEVENGRSIALLERLAFRPASPDESAGHSLTPTERLYVRSAA